MAKGRHTTRSRLAGLGLLGGRALLIIVGAILVIAAAKRSGLALDWSANARFTVDPALEQIIGGLERDYEIVGLWPQNPAPDQAWMADLGERVTGSIERINASSERLRWRRIDPDLDRPLLEDFQERYGEASPGALYVVRDGRRPFRIPLSPALPILLQQEIGGALVALADDNPPRALVLQGHGELRPGGGPRDGVDQLLRRLELGGFVVDLADDATLDRLGRIPADALVVLPGPTSPLGDELIGQLLQHLRDGGGMLLLADQRLDPAFARKLRPLGLLTAAGFPQEWPQRPEVLGDDQAPPRPPLAAYSERSTGRDGSYHRLLLGADQGNVVVGWTGILRQVASAGQGIWSPWSMPAEAIDPQAYGPELGERIRSQLAELGTPPAQVQALLALMPGQGWLGAPALRQEPVPSADRGSWSIALAWAMEWQADGQGANGDRGGRLVFWGSRQAASDEALAGDRWANGQLLADMASWGADRAGQVAIPPAQLTAYRAEVDDDGLFWILALTVCLLPCLFIGGGIIAWWERRSD